jgi:DNA (cytosine-5)-methyltransferase 1
MTRPVLLDLFCCAGGAAMGYHRAGFDVIGVDIEPQPLYPFRFVQANALEALAAWNLAAFDVIHASPPCQRFTQMSARWRGVSAVADGHPDLLTPVLAILRALGRPYVVENVQGAAKHMRTTVTLHGGMFGLEVHRPRRFESNILILAPKAPHAKDPIGVYGERPDGRRLRTRQNGDMKGKRSILRAARSVEEAQRAMGMPWADWHGCKEAIPPAYTEYIGLQLLDHLGHSRPDS